MLTPPERADGFGRFIQPIESKLDLLPWLGRSHQGAVHLYFTHICHNGLTVKLPVTLPSGPTMVAYLGFDKKLLAREAGCCIVLSWFLTDTTNGTAS
jgi:hypothetical protein